MSNSVAFRTDRESDPTSFPPRSRLLLGTAPALGFRSQSNVFECVAIDCVTLVSQTEDAKGHPNIISEECSTGKYEKPSVDLYAGCAECVCFGGPSDSDCITMSEWANDCPIRHRPEYGGSQ